MEEVNADRMLAEMVRVTRPGGRIGVAVRSLDMPQWVNLQLSAELKAKVDAPESIAGRGAGMAESGCADASLYLRFRDAGLTAVKALPQLASATGPWLDFIESRLLPTLNEHEVMEWRGALVEAESEGTFFIARPFHCAVGTKK
jgi:hypothetical protein